MMKPAYIDQVTSWVQLNCDATKPLMWTLYRGQEPKATAPVAAVQSGDLSYGDSLRQLIEMCRIVSMTQSYCTITCKSAINATGNTCTFELTNQPANMAGIYGMGQVSQANDSKYEEERTKREKLEKELEKMKLEKEFDERFRKLEEKYQERPSAWEKALENPAIMGVLGPIIQNLITPAASVAVAGVGERMEEPAQAQPTTDNNGQQVAVDYNTIMTVCHLLVEQGYPQPHQVLALCVQHPEEFKKFVHSVTTNNDGKDS